MNPEVWSLKWELLGSTFLSGIVYYAVQGGSNFEFVDEILHKVT